MFIVNGSNANRESRRVKRQKPHWNNRIRYQAWIVILVLLISTTTAFAMPKVETIELVEPIEVKNVPPEPISILSSVIPLTIEIESTPVEIEEAALSSIITPIIGDVCEYDYESSYPYEGWTMEDAEKMTRYCKAEAMSRKSAERDGISYQEWRDGIKMVAQCQADWWGFMRDVPADSWARPSKEVDQDYLAIVLEVLNGDLYQPDHRIRYFRSDRFKEDWYAPYIGFVAGHWYYGDEIERIPETITIVDTKESDASGWLSL